MFRLRRQICSQLEWLKRPLSEGITKIANWQFFRKTDIAGKLPIGNFQFRFSRSVSICVKMPVQEDRKDLLQFIFAYVGRKL